MPGRVQPNVESNIMNENIISILILLSTVVSFFISVKYLKLPKKGWVGICFSILFLVLLFIFIAHRLSIGFSFSAL